MTGLEPSCSHSSTALSKASGHQPCAQVCADLWLAPYHCLSMAIPMSLKFRFMPEYHRIAFFLLVSAGICYLSGQYRFTVDANNPSGLRTCRNIVFVQLVINLLTRVMIWFPAAYGASTTFYQLNDWWFFCGGCCGMLGMSLYNIVITVDASEAATKWLPNKFEVQFLARATFCFFARASWPTCTV